MKTLTIEVDSKEYHEVEELLRLVAVTPEHAISEFVKDLISQKDEILKRYEEGEAAKQLIEEAVAPSLRKVVDRTLQQRQMLRELELHKKVEPISKLRKSWGSALEWADSPGNLLMITRNDQRAAAMISVETALAMSSMAVDDQTIQTRCRLMEMLNHTTSAGRSGQ